MKLQEWEQQIIKDAFNRFYGLKQAVKNNDDKQLQKAALISLSELTGFQVSFLENHLECVSNLA